MTVRRLLAVGAIALGSMATAVEAACTIQSSPCYPWRIEADASDTVLLEIVPSNVPTPALYRVCVCAPAKSVSLIFDFEDRKVPIGKVELGSGATVCRDYRIQTARKSRLLLSRAPGETGLVEGCYTTQ